MSNMSGRKLLRMKVGKVGPWGTRELTSLACTVPWLVDPDVPEACDAAGSLTEFPPDWGAASSLLETGLLLMIQSNDLCSVSS